jgi:hypothetical protein
MRTPYPIRAGSSAAAWRAHILDVLAWKAGRYGAAVWETNAADLGARGQVALAALVAEGLVSSTRKGELLPSYQGTDHFGRGSGWVNARHVEHIRIERAA